MCTASTWSVGSSVSLEQLSMTIWNHRPLVIFSTANVYRDIKNMIYDDQIVCREFLLPLPHGPSKYLVRLGRHTHVVFERVFSDFIIRWQLQNCISAAHFICCVSQFLICFFSPSLSFGVGNTIVRAQLK